MNIRDSGIFELHDSTTIESPCVRNCCLDEKDICLGCFRHLDEITGWGKFDDAEKIKVLLLTEQRKNNHKLSTGN